MLANWITLRCFLGGFCSSFYCVHIFPEGVVLCSLRQRQNSNRSYLLFAIWQVAYTPFWLNSVVTLISKEWSRIFQSAFYR